MRKSYVNSESLLDIAERSYEQAEIFFKIKSDDEAHYNLIGYLLQQSCEVCLKHILEMSGVRYPFSHDIATLLETYRENALKYGISENLYFELLDRADTITKWEAKTRYIKNFRLSLREIEIGFKLIKKLLTSVRNFEDTNMDCDEGYTDSQTHLFGD